MSRTTIPDEHISHLSTEYIRVPVIATENGNAVDPTADVVQMAFPAHNTEPATWFTASWETAGSLHFARCLIGPAGVTTLAAGLYDVHTKIADSPEIPVKRAGLLEVY